MVLGFYTVFSAPILAPHPTASVRRRWRSRTLFPLTPQDASAPAEECKVAPKEATRMEEAAKVSGQAWDHRAVSRLHLTTPAHPSSALGLPYAKVVVIPK